MSNVSINKNLSIKLSLEWIKLSFMTFRECPLQFIALAIIATIVSILPFMGAFMTPLFFMGAFMTPLFVAQFMVITSQVESGHGCKMSELFKGFFSRNEITKLALVNFFLSTVIILVQYLLEEIITNFIKDATILSIVISSLTIFSMLLMLVLQMTMWFAPIICLSNNGIPTRTAMWLSIKATFYNIPTVFIYSLLLVAITSLAILPFGLGLIVWLPILNITTYHVYRNLFTVTN